MARAYRQNSLDSFADLLAAGVEPEQAARWMGYKTPEHTARTMLSRICKKLGWQAQ